jgi:hypothetical protein
MAVNYDNTTKNNRLQAVIDRIGSGGFLRIGTTGMGTVLATIPLASPAFATPAGGAMALAGTPLTDTAADATGAAAEASIVTSGGTAIISGLTVGTAAANINLNSTAIQVGQEVRITSGTITHG